MWVNSFCSLLDHDPDFFSQIPIFCWSDPDFSIQLSGRSDYSLKPLKVKVKFEMIWQKRLVVIQTYRKKIASSLSVL